MKLSEISMNDIPNLSIKQKQEIVQDFSAEFNTHAEFALLLGSCPEKMLPRTQKAAKIFLEGKVDYIIPTGGVLWEVDSEQISEANYMFKKLIELGVPEDKILIENEARTTRENFICSLLTMERKSRLAKIKNVVVVTSPNHLKRSMHFAKWLIPDNINISGIASDDIEKYETQQQIDKINKEVRLLKDLVDNQLMEDIEFSN